MTIFLILLKPLNSLKKTLRDSGLSTLAESLGFSGEEKQKGLNQAIITDKKILLCYGKKIKLWDSLSYEEKTIVNLTSVIDNYDSLEDHPKKQFNLKTLKLLLKSK